MTKPLIVLPAAEADIRQAAAWYERRRPGMGQVFLLQVELALSRVHRFPEIYQRLSGDTRRAVMRQFPYVVAYRACADRIEVVAIKHCALGPADLLPDPPAGVH